MRLIPLCFMNQLYSIFHYTTSRQQCLTRQHTLRKKCLAPRTGCLVWSYCQRRPTDPETLHVLLIPLVTLCPF